MIRSVFGLVAALALVSEAGAQETVSMQRAIGALSSPPTAEEIQQLGADNANAYVFLLQDYLRSTGGYDGVVNGQLTNATIRAIVAFCQDQGFVETCIRGPLLPESIAAVSRALSIALSPAPPVVEVEQPVAEEGAATAEEPAAETAATTIETPAPAAAVEPPVLPEGWRLNENGSRGSLGVTAELVSAGPSEAVIHFRGTAVQRGYFNIDLSPMQPAGPGTWATSVEGSSIHAPGTSGVVRLRMAKLSADAYLGELFEGVPLDGDTKVVTGSGVADGGVARLLPLVQLWAEAGDVIDVIVTLRNPSFGPQ